MNYKDNLNPKNNVILAFCCMISTYGFMMIVQFYCDYLYMQYNNEKVNDIFANFLNYIDSNKYITTICNPDYTLYLCIFVYLYNINKLDNRFKIMTKTCILLSMSFILRMITISSTIMPPSNKKCTAFYYDFKNLDIDILYYAILRMFNFINTCTDKIYSGHISVATIFLLSWNKYIIKYNHILILLLILMSIGTIINRNHYTVDVTVSIIINYLLFKNFN